MKPNSIPSAGTEAQKSDAAEVTTSSQPCGNTDVVRSPNVAPFKTVTIEEAIASLLNMEVGLVIIGNDFDYFSILNQVNSLMSSIVNYGFTKKILSCEKIELTN